MPLMERRVRESWNSLYAEIRKMGGEARPNQAGDIFVLRPTDEGIEVEVKPVTFRLKEKAESGDNSIYVVVEGTLLFSSESTRDQLWAGGFATRVGYFREVDEKRLKHVYGIHYDYDDSLPAHPVYHCQLSSMAAMVHPINTAFNRDFDAVEDNDNYVMGLLRNVRVPTAHMDPFSVFLQIIGDHLVSEINDDQRIAFTRAQAALATIRSLPAAAARLDSVFETQCFRANHWYRDAKHQNQG
ncbi:MAG: hypothetical protein ACJ8FT_00720 [Sphingomonas sp.]